MFARTAFRTLQSAAPLRQLTSCRRYATGPSPSSGSSSSTLLIAAVTAAAAGGGGYYFYSTSAAPAEKVTATAKETAAGAASEVTGAHKETFTGGSQGFLSLELESVETLNHNTKQFRFKLPEEDSVSGMHAASALLTKFKPEGAEKPVVRPYTAVSDDDAVGHLDLLVKKYEGGPMSTHIHSLVPGQKLEIKGPITKYPWAPNKHEHIALLAGGTGITPMYQLLQAIFKNPGVDKTKVTLVFGNIAEEDILLRKQLNELENTYPQQFRAFYVLEKPPSDKWTGGSKGYITKDLLKEVLPEPTSGDIKLFVCGPPGLMKAVSGPKKSPSNQGELTGALKELGYTAEQVVKL